MLMFMISREIKQFKKLKKTILGLAIVPMINLAEMFKENKLDLKQAKIYLSASITLAYNAVYETIKC